MSEVKAVIKDCISESVMTGNDVRLTLRNLHVIDGFNKDDIIAVYNEMVEEIERDISKLLTEGERNDDERNARKFGIKPDLSARLYRRYAGDSR